MRRILVVDDEEIIVNMMAGQLADQFDVEVCTAYSAVEAMELLRKMKFSIVISDIAMPAVSGLDLLDFVKKNWPACHVIMMTAYSEFDYAYHTLKYDKVDYVLKIDGYERLSQIVQKHMDQLAREEELQEYYNRLDDTKSGMSSYFRARAVDKLFGYDMAVKQSELDILQVPLSLKQPVLLAVGSLQDDLVPEVKEDIFSIPDYVEKVMSMKGIRTVFHDRNGIMLWIFQADDEDWEAETAVVYIRESFDELSELVNVKMGNKMSLVMNTQFGKVTELLDVYQKAVMELEQMHGEGCVRLLMEQEESLEGRDSTQLDYPNSEELNYLLSLLKKKSEKELLEALETKLNFLRSIKDLRKVLPLPAVSAMELLLTEAKRLYHTEEETQHSLMKSLYTSEREVSGALWLEEALTRLKGRMAEGDRKSGIHSRHLISWVNEYIDAHYMEPISLTSLAELVNYNPTYLSRLYSEQTGTTLVEAINLRRVKEAQKLLRESGMKIKDIAISAGFYSVKHFNQVFKRYTGVSAGDYRKQ